MGKTVRDKRMGGLARYYRSHNLPDRKATQLRNVKLHLFI